MYKKYNIVYTLHVVGETRIDITPFTGSAAFGHIPRHRWRDEIDVSQWQLKLVILYLCPLASTTIITLVQIFTNEILFIFTSASIDSTISNRG